MAKKKATKKLVTKKKVEKQPPIDMKKLFPVPKKYNLNVPDFADEEQSIQFLKSMLLTFDQYTNEEELAEYIKDTSKSINLSVVSVIDAYNYIMKKDKLTDKVLFCLHKKVVERELAMQSFQADVAGKWRKTEFVRYLPLQYGGHYKPPRASVLPKLMKNWITDINSHMPLTEDECWFYSLKFISLEPFIGGAEMMGRLLWLWLLKISGKDFNNIGDIDRNDYNRSMAHFVHKYGNDMIVDPRINDLVFDWKPASDQWVWA